MTETANPSPWEVTPVEAFKRLAATIPEESHSNGGKQRSYTNAQFDLPKWIADNNLEVIGPHSWNGGQKWIFPVCPWNSDHTNRSAFIIQFPTGAISARCHHNGCAGKDWHDLRDIVEPGWRKTFDGFWHDPAEIPAGLLPVPPLDPCLIPKSFRPWLADIADRMQCPIEFLFVGAIVSLASVVGRRGGIRPKKHDDWTVVPNLWGAAIGRPGIMKTPALNEVLKPLRRLEVEAAKSNDEKLKAFEVEKALVKAKKDVAGEKIKKALKTGEDTTTLLADLSALSAIEPTAARFIVNDPTVEKLGELLNQNPKGLLLFRDELVGWLKTLDREGHENDRAFYLESWNGTGPYTYDRIGRGTLRIDAACVSILGGIQPGPLNDYLKAAVLGDKGADGLIQRFQVAVYPDSPKNWTNVDKWPDSAAKNRAFKIYEKLADPQTFAGFEGATTQEKRTKEKGAEEKNADSNDGESIPFLRFAPDAQEFFDEWHANLEHRLLAEEEHPVIEAHLSKFRSLMPSLALLFHLVDAIDGETSGPVSIHAAKMAAACCDFLEQHARRIYQSITQRYLMAANQLAKKIEAGRVKNPFSARDVYNNGWSGLSERDDVQRAAEILESYFWLKAESLQTDGRPKVQFWINPKLSKQRQAA